MRIIVVAAALTALAVPGVARAEPVTIGSAPLQATLDGLGGLQVSYPAGDAAKRQLFAGGDNGFALRSGRTVSYPSDDDRVADGTTVNGPSNGVTTATSTFHLDDLALEVVETDRVADGSRDVRRTFRVTDTGTVDLPVKAGELADTTIGGDDWGRGVMPPGPSRILAGLSPGGQLSGLVEVTRWDHFQEGFYDDVFTAFESRALHDTVGPNYADDGLGAEWDFTLKPGEANARTIAVTWRFDCALRVTTRRAAGRHGSHRPAGHRGRPELAAPAITSPTDGSTVASPISFRGTAPPGALVYVSSEDAHVEAEPVQAGDNGDWTMQFPPLDRGTYRFVAEAFDPESGAESPPSATVTLTVGTLPPHISAAPVSGSTVTLTGTAQPGDAITIFEGAAQVGGPVPADANGNWTVVLTGVRPGTHSYTAVARDLAGNSSPPSAPRTVTVAAPTPAPTPTPTPTSTPTPTPTSTPTPLPSPVKGRNVNVRTKSGTVKIELPGTNRFVELGAGQQVPVGTTVDTTHGRVTLTAAAGRPGQTQTADFYQGIFTISQTTGRKPITQLRLSGPKPTCTAKAARAFARASAKRRVTTRRLWGSGHGSFRTRGQYSAATVRGTTWLTQDTCAGTLTRVTHGVVQVQDFVRHKKVIVRAGKRYLARARRR